MLLALLLTTALPELPELPELADARLSLDAVAGGGPFVIVTNSELANDVGSTVWGGATARARVAPVLLRVRVAGWSDLSSACCTTKYGLTAGADAGFAFDFFDAFEFSFGGGVSTGAQFEPTQIAAPFEPTAFPTGALAFTALSWSPIDHVAVGVETRVQLEMLLFDLRARAWPSLLGVVRLSL